MVDDQQVAEAAHPIRIHDPPRSDRPNRRALSRAQKNSSAADWSTALGKKFTHWSDKFAA